MRRIICGGLAVLWCSTVIAQGACPIGYVPQTIAADVTRNDVLRSGASERDIAVATDIIDEYGQKEAALLSKHEEVLAKVLQGLNSARPDRSGIELYVEKMVDVSAQLSALRVDRAIEFKEKLGERTLRKMRARPAFRSFQCQESVALPDMRYGLRSQEVVPTEQEIKYLRDFERRERSFWQEERDVFARLDLALKKGTVDRLEVEQLLKRSRMNVKHSLSNRLDKYFYAEQTLFVKGRAVLPLGEETVKLDPRAAAKKEALLKAQDRRAVKQAAKQEVRLKSIARVAALREAKKKAKEKAKEEAKQRRAAKMFAKEEVRQRRQEKRAEKDKARAVAKKVKTARAVEQRQAKLAEKDRIKEEVAAENALQAGALVKKKWYWPF